MIKQGYNASKMVHTADEFYQSLGLIKMNDGFWNNSYFTQPDRPFVCHASAWDFYNAKDFRIKMCISVNMGDFVVIHHEMGHIEYYMQYSGQPIPFRNGANDGFHEAIGDTMALSVSTPKHLKAIGLLPDLPNANQDINFMMRQALQKVAFLPFGYLIDLWRWKVFDGTYNTSYWNRGWWDLRSKYQGITPPVPRSESDFDPAAKSHINDNTPYLRYFIAFIVEFQFYQALCSASGITYVITLGVLRVGPILAGVEGRDGNSPVG